MKISAVLLLMMSLVSLNSQAETTAEEFPGQQNPPTYDQPWRSGQSAMIEGDGQGGVVMAADPLERGVGPGNTIPQSPVPPTRGVIHVQSTNGEAIDPEREYPILGGRPVVANQIDPEREYPILGGRPGVVLSEIDPEQERPILGGGGLFGLLFSADDGKGLTIDPEQEERPAPINRPGGWRDWLSQITIPGLGPARDPLPPNVTASTIRDTGSGLPPGQVDLPVIEALRSVLPALNEPDLQVHAVQLSVAAVATSTLILAYKMLGIGGRQRALAAIVPPQMIMDHLGRPGYRVPSHSEYSAEEALDVAREMHGMSVEELTEYTAQFPPDFIEYVILVGTWVRQAMAQEFAEQCPDPDLCA